MFLFFTLAAFASATESNDIADHVDVDQCICDLTRYSCDSFCCCDSECISQVVQTWQDQDLCEAEKFTSYSRLYCYKKGKFFQESTEKDTIDPLFKLLCVQYNNAPDWGIYHELIDDSNSYSSDVIEKLKEKTYYPSKLFFADPASSESSLSPGDKMRVVYLQDENDWQPLNGFWVLPTSNSAGLCDFASPVRWMLSQAARTCRVDEELEAACSTYFDISKYSDIEVSSLKMIDYLKGVGVTVKKWFKRVDSQDSPFSGKDIITSFSKGKCSNAVVQADFRVFSNADMNGVESIEVDLIVQDLTSNNVTQSFSVKFFTSTDAKELSGNPGYVKGKPLITGKTVDGNIEILSNFTIFGIDSEGKCEKSSVFYSKTVNYGQDTLISCFKSFDSLESFCKTENLESLELFTGASITHIAKYGNIDTSKSDDWVKISSSDMPSASFSENSCTLPTLLVFDVLFTQVGPYSNPQDKIVYVRKSFKTSTLTEGSSKRLLFGVSFNFIHYDEDFDPYTPDTSSSVRTTPDDVVYVVRSHALVLSLIVLPLLF
jgi:hypothetical protein